MKKNTPSTNDATAWRRANYTYLSAELQRLRLLLQRRVLWLRKQWHRDPAPNYQGLAISDGQADALLAGENPQAEQRFFREDPEARSIGESLAKLEAEQAEQVRTFMEAQRPPAIEMLAHIFDLSPFERDVLLLCLAAELDPAFEKLFAYVQDDATRKFPTLQLALALFSGAVDSPLAARESLMPSSMVRRFCLVNPDPGPAPTLGARPLRLDERIVDYLLGVNHPDERVSELLRPLSAQLLPPDHGKLVDQLLHGLRSEGSQGHSPAVNLIGPLGAGKCAVAQALCRRMGLELYKLHAAALPTSGAERQEASRLLEREAMLCQFALYLDMAALEDAESENASNAVAEFVEGLGVFLVVGSSTRWAGERAIFGATVSKPDSKGRRALWQQALAGCPSSLNGDLEGLVQQFEFGPGAISRVVAAARGLARLRHTGGDGTLTVEDLQRACREHAGWRLGKLAQRIVPCHGWEDIILPADSLRQLEEIAQQVGHRRKVYEEWGFGAKLNRGKGISALFTGPSGTGKTLAAEILTNHLDLHLYRIDLSGVISKYIGETEKNLRKVFDIAEQSGAVLFFDEADALFGKRSEVKDSHDRYANIEINYLLQRMEDYRGLAILATNMKSHMDQAFMRRLRFMVDFPFPDAMHRARIWRKIFPADAAVEGLDYASLARLEITGGNIKNIALNACFLAAATGQQVSMKHVLQATRREYSKIDKLIQEVEFGSYYEALTP